MISVTAAAAPGLACAQRSKNASLPYCDSTATRGEPAATGPQPGYGGGDGPLAPTQDGAAVPNSRLLGGRAWSGHDPQLHKEAERVRPTPVLGLSAVLHPEEVDPAGGGLLPGRGDADKLALVGAGVGHPGSHQWPAKPGTYTPHHDIPGAICELVPDSTIRLCQGIQHREHHDRRLILGRPTTGYDKVTAHT